MPGLTVEHGTVDTMERALLIAAVLDALRTVKVEGNQERNRVHRWGWSYLDMNQWLGHAPAAIYPRQLDRVWFESVTVNEYEPHHGISLHVDARGFDEPVVVLSLGSPCTMLFRDPQARHVTEVPVREGTMVTMNGPARWDWWHGTAPDNEGVRWSVVYRRKKVDTSQLEA